jgi:hypothetical protein
MKRTAVHEPDGPACLRRMDTFVHGEAPVLENVEEAGHFDQCLFPDRHSVLDGNM